MLVTFVPSGANADTALLTFQKGTVIPAQTPGSALYPMVNGGKAMLLWQNPNQQSMQDWPMDDEAAVDTAMVNLTDALADSVIAVELESDGNVVAVVPSS